MPSFLPRQIFAALWMSLAVMSTASAQTTQPATDPAMQILREDWHDAARDRTLPIRIDYPAHITGPCPVVILSHGLGSSREALDYLGAALAEHGYIAVHLQHPGSDSSLWKGLPMEQALQQLKAAITLEQFLARVDDVHFALDELPRRNADPNWPLHGKLNLQEMAMAGHSFGAVTTQAVCGQTYPGDKRFFDARLKAGVALSPNPPAPGEDAATAFAHMGVPMLYWTGTLDVVPFGISNVTAIQRRIPFDNTHGTDAYLGILTGATHLSFNGRITAGDAVEPQEAGFHDVVVRGTVAFLDKYLKHDGTQAAYLDNGGFADVVQPMGTFEVKHGPLH